MLCKHCGKDSDESVDSSEETAETNKSMSIWFKALICLVALSIGALLINTILTEDLTDTVKSQLNAIKEGNLSEAYYVYSSKKFQEATSFDNFSEFIKTHPAFSENKSIQFKERNVDTDFGTLDSVMVTHQNKKILVEYKLIKESDLWKILSIRLEDLAIIPLQKENSFNSLSHSAPSNTNNILKFNQFVLGNSLSILGLVKNPTNKFKKDSGDIYLNLYITNANAGTPIQINFEHQDSHSMLNPVSTKTASDGEAILSFVFSPPKENWPQGNYRINASTTDNIKDSIEFSIE